LRQGLQNTRLAAPLPGTDIYYRGSTDLGEAVMSDNKFTENDPERTLITLDQLSQTIEVMTSVVNRLRQHLSQQISAKQELEQLHKEQERQAEADKLATQDRKQESFVVEITQPEMDSDTKDDKTYH